MFLQRRFFISRTVFSKGERRSVYWAEDVRIIGASRKYRRSSIPDLENFSSGIGMEP